MLSTRQTCSPGKLARRAKQPIPTEAAGRRGRQAVGRREISRTSCTPVRCRIEHLNALEVPVAFDKLRRFFFGPNHCERGRTTAEENE
jgi:hypothetical protein